MIEKILKKLNPGRVTSRRIQDIPLTSINCSSTEMDKRIANAKTWVDAGIEKNEKQFLKMGFVILGSLINVTPKTFSTEDGKTYIRNAMVELFAKPGIDLMYHYYEYEIRYGLSLNSVIKIGIEKYVLSADEKRAIYVYKAQDYNLLTSIAQILDPSNDTATHLLEYEDITE